MSEDKYPSESGRRRFVKGVVGSAALSGVGVGGAATVDIATQPSGGGGGPTPYVGIELVGGPAPRGMPYIPVEIADNGDIRGVWPEVEEVTEAGTTYEVAQTQIGGQTYSSEWFQYCGRQNAQGVVPSADQDNTFVSIDSPPYEWQSSELSGGDPLNIEHFSDYDSWGNEIGDEGVGKPARARWRSEGTDSVLPVTVIRSPLIEEKAQQDGEVGEWYSAASAQGVIAYMNVCTHFCCVPGYKVSGDAATYDIANGVYCQCHQSRYDPFSPEFGTFVALPRPE
ncbi:ubiquinol-cytochrome c reductase iron-sulfur subunit [Natronomonas salina]|uniref:Rieske 2Fe-2S domain-containing protein n=1 Tax=Natronomonas salina TaxID=1710540 RepID=UPI0015B7447B|nr:ubiquinol-cytochrome c reductase iron-sulfur subunit [Natronomonas salina]